MKNKNIKEILFYFSLIFIMVMSLNLAIMDSTGMNLPLVRMAFFTLITTAAVSVILIFPISLLVFLIPGICRILYLYYTDAALINLYVQKILGFFYWLYGYTVGYNNFEPGYSLVFAIMYTAFITLIVSIIVYSGRAGFMLITLGTAVLSFFWFIYVGKARLYLVLYLSASILLYSYQIYKRKLKEWRKAGSSVEYDVGRNWMLCSAIVVSISLILSLALPLNISAVRWPWFNDKVVSLFPFIADWRNDTLESFSYGFNSRYSLSSAGYRSKKLGGEVLLDESVMMTVKTLGEETLYLRGAVKDKYSDNSWSKSSKSYKEYSPGYAMPLPYGSSVTTREAALEITYKKLLTSTIFAPYSVYQVQHSFKRIFADEDSEVYTPKMIMRDEPYTVKSIMPYIDVEKLRQAKTESLGGNEFKVYTALPSDISGRAKTLAWEITKVQNNDYDKVKAIESYLRQNYKYTLKPQKVPSKVEFTDHFLFEGKEGYCTYFATSMAVLLRASGIPCRYVEGFVSRYGGAEVREVRGTDAHAWVEVYFDDYGWVTFEPTPQYPAIELKAAREALQETNIDTQEGTAADSIDRSDMSRRRRDMEIEEGSAAGTANGSEEKRSSHIGNTALFVLLSLLIIRFGFMYLVWAVKEVSLGHSKGRRYAMDYIKDVIWYLRHAGFTIGKEETIREFLKRVKYNYEERFSDISNVTQILEKIRYSDSDVSAEERRLLEVFRKKVKKLALKKAGVLQFFISLYLTGK
ncbi:MAG TPA: transglutaminaseTgpA domain-containing protein [Clostridia bacterium]|nr:transglutaminaseTgpA domain-containing protein [Clostridia bacterium]